MHPNHLSWLLNEQFGKNFNELVNHHRVPHSTALREILPIASSPSWRWRYDSGFNSKTVFNTCFKKETGQTPSKFLKGKGPTPFLLKVVRDYNSEHMPEIAHRCGKQLPHLCPHKSPMPNQRPLAQTQKKDSMKAAITTGYGPADVFKMATVETPTAQPHEILVKIHASSVTRADTMMRTGKPYIGRLFTGVSKPKHPIWGTGFAGVVAAVGSAVTRFKAGDKVFGESIASFGTYAEYLAVDADGYVAHLPHNLNFEAAASLCDGGITSLNFLCNLGNIKAGQQVLINGASGSLGSAAIQIAKHFGAVVTGVCSTNSMAMVRELGADYVIDYTQTDFTTHTNCYDLIYDTVGKRSFAECRKALSTHGVYASPVLGMPLLRDVLRTSMAGTRKAKFSATGALPKKETKRLLDLLISIVESGHLQPTVDRAYPLEKVAEAHAYVDKGHKKGNVVLRPTKDVAAFSEQATPSRQPGKHAINI